MNGCCQRQEEAQDNNRLRFSPKDGGYEGHAKEHGGNGRPAQQFREPSRRPEPHFAGYKSGRGYDAASNETRDQVRYNRRN